MIIHNQHISESASLRDAIFRLAINPQTALRLYGVIEIMPLRGIVAAIADNHFISLLINNIKSKIRSQALGHDDAVGRLVVLQQGGDDARQGKGRAVQRVAELGLLGCCVAVAALQAVSLIGVEVRY